MPIIPSALLFYLFPLCILSANFTELDTVLITESLKFLALTDQIPFNQVNTGCNHVFKITNRKMMHNIQLLTNITNLISNKMFDDEAITIIQNIANESFLNLLYRYKLPSILRNCFHKLQSFSSINDSIIVSDSYMQLLTALNLSPPKSSYGAQFNELYPVIQLLVLTSGALVQSVAFDSFEWEEKQYEEFIKILSEKHNLLLIFGYEDFSNHVFDVIKLMYRHCYSHINKYYYPLPLLSDLYSNQHSLTEFINYLIAEFGFVPWDNYLSKPSDNVSFTEFCLNYQEIALMFIEDILGDHQFENEFIMSLNLEFICHALEATNQDLITFGPLIEDGNIFHFTTKIIRKTLMYLYVNNKIIDMEIIINKLYRLRGYLILQEIMYFEKNVDFGYYATTMDILMQIDNIRYKRKLDLSKYRKSTWERVIEIAKN